MKKERRRNGLNGGEELGDSFLRPVLAEDGWQNLAEDVGLGDRS